MAPLLLIAMDDAASPLFQDKLCLPHHILEERGLVKVGVTVQALLDLPPSKPTQLSAVWHEPECFWVQPSSQIPLSPPAQTQAASPGTREPLRVRTRWSVALWESASAWLKQESGGRSSSISWHDVRRHLPLVHHIFTCILLPVCRGHLVRVWTRSVTVCLACQGETDKTVGTSRRPSILQSRSVISQPVSPTVLTTVPCWCWRHWQCGHYRRLTHSFTKDTQPTDRVILRRLCTLMFLSFLWNCFCTLGRIYSIVFF